MPARTLKLSVNQSIINKNDGGDSKAFSSGWDSKTLTLKQLADHINLGHAFSAQFKQGIRKGSNFSCADFVAVDVDGTLSLEEGRNHEFVRSYGSIFYTTPSHRKENRDRFRVVFATPKTITSGQEWSDALVGLAQLIGGDLSSTDKARLFYGSKGSEPELLGNSLNEDALEQLVQHGRDNRQKNRPREVNQNPAIDAASRRSSNVLDINRQLRLRNGTLVAIGELLPRTAVYCPFHNDTNPSAFTVLSKSKVPGVHCSTCRQTYWTPGIAKNNYDFYSFDKIATRLGEEEHARNSHTRQPRPFTREVRLLNQRYLPELPRTTGIILVKSPKGSGKTERIKDIVRDAREHNKSVLVIGHRRTLLKDLAQRLNLKCYLDDEHPRDYESYDQGAWTKVHPERPDYYAVSVDSLPVRLKKARPYDIVIIDECEQVFQHVCAATLKQVSASLKRLEHYVSTVPTIYLFDADLNKITNGFVTTCRSKHPHQHIHIVLNTFAEPGPVCQLFSSHELLADDLLKSVKEGKRTFTVCNSKRRAKTLATLLKKEVGPNLRQILITAEETNDPDVQEFLGGIRTKILDFDSVVASPAIGTGIDITFPNDEKNIDVVYGFFNTQVNSHYDIDQQLGRVRNPKEVKVWVASGESAFETESAVVMRDIAETSVWHEAIKGFDLEGNEVFDERNATLRLQADSYCAQRASQNRLKHYFVKHKERNGWTVRKVGGDKSQRDIIKGKLGAAESDVDAQLVQSIVSAARIDKSRYEELLSRRAQNKPIGIRASFEVQRFELEDFYKEAVSEKLVQLDDGGRYREAVERFEKLNRRSEEEIKSLKESVDKFANGSKWAKAFYPRNDLLLEPLLVSTGLVANNIGLDKMTCVSKSDLATFIKLCADRKIAIERLLKVRVRRDIGRDPVKTLNLFLKLVGQQAENIGSTKVKGSKIYRYRLNGDDFDQMKTIVQRRGNAGSTFV